jgi:hypothetical protein
MFIYVHPFVHLYLYNNNNNDDDDDDDNNNNNNNNCGTQFESFKKLSYPFRLIIQAFFRVYGNLNIKLITCTK